MAAFVRIYADMAQNLADAGYGAAEVTAFGKMQSATPGTEVGVQLDSNLNPMGPPSAATPAATGRR